MKTMKIQGDNWYGARKMKVPDPEKYETPYGGRLVWTLPGSTQVICHLKVRKSRYQMWRIIVSCIIFIKVLTHN